MLGSADLVDDLSGRRSLRAARTQVRVTSGSLTTASVPQWNSTWIVPPLASDRPKAIWRIRSSTRAVAAALRVRIVPLSKTLSGMMLALRSALDAAEGDHDRIARIDRARHELVNTGDELRGNADRIDRLVGPGRMPAQALDLDLKLLAERRQHSLAVAKPSRGRLRVDMQRNHGLDVAHRPGGDHLESALANLFGRLEDGPPGEPLGQFVAALPEGQRSAQGHGRMSVVPAGVHDAVARRSVRDRLGVVDAQGVDICPVRDHRLRVGIGRPRDDTASGRCDRAGDSRLFEFLGEKPRGLVLLAARFGAGVQPAADLAKQLPPRLYRLVNRLAPTDYRQGCLHAL